MYTVITGLLKKEKKNRTLSANKIALLRGDKAWPSEDNLLLSQRYQEKQKDHYFYMLKL